MIGKSEEYEGNKRHIEVQILVEGGKTIQGQLAIVGQRTFAQFLNAGPDFLEFVMLDGTTTWFARKSILQIWEHSIPLADQLKDRLAASKNFDAFEILGVKRGANMKSVHKAYVRLAKTYHPDRFSGANLPSEMTAYVQSMSKRINAAYTELEFQMKTPEAETA